MRIISGTARGKKLLSPEETSTRPTLDRVKEALFNILQNDIRDAVVLDLFAGTGNLGIEALSRGAKEAVFCDSSLKAINVINKNIDNTKVSNKALIINKDYIETLKILAEKNKKFDIIFLDPPYTTDFAIKAINTIIELNLLSQEGKIILETDDNKKEEEILKNKRLQIFDKRKYGIAILIFIRKG